MHLKNLHGGAEGFAEAFAADDRHGGRLLRSLRGAGEGIDPAQPGKAAEIAVVAVQDRLIFDGQSRDVGIGEQGAAQRAGFAEACEDAQVARAGLQDQHGRLLQP